MSGLEGVAIGVGIVVVLLLLLFSKTLGAIVSFFFVGGIVLLLVAGVIGGVLMIASAVRYNDAFLGVAGAVLASVSGFVLYFAFTNFRK